jgi:hypothetical protein
MKPEDAQRALEFAEAMVDQFVAVPEPLFWCGYRRGLRRALYGRRFSSNMVHYAWLEFRQESDPVLAELGRGYVAGIEAVVSGKSAGADMHDGTAHASDADRREARGPLLGARDPLLE